MDLALIRTEFDYDGIFSELRDPSGDDIAITLERSYKDNLGGFIPKLQDGVYECVRGLHRLKGMTNDFETFEVMNVPGHTDILFHIGNFNTDSSGCILLGVKVAIIDGHKAIASSKLAFKAFMDLQTGYDNFSLTVKTP